MKRRDFLRQTAATGVAVSFPGASSWSLAAAEAAGISERFPALADAALNKATALGATFADFHIMQTDSESLSARENMIQGVGANTSLGCSVRVLVDGAWGFAAGPEVNVEAVVTLTRSAVAVAREQAGWQSAPIQIETLPAHVDTWQLPIAEDPFTVPIEEKAGRLLEINRIALDKGANYCSSFLRQVRETKWLANTFGSRIEQTRVRVYPGFSVTLTDPKKGQFGTRASIAQPKATGYEYVREYDFAAEAALAVEEAREKLTAPSVTPGPMDLIIHPSNLWLTIHETVGHPTELDRALGYEANFAGTSFCTPDKLDKLQYASDIVTIRGDRTHSKGLASVAYDDDGVKTDGREFNIIDRGVFSNYQMALGQAQKIGRNESNGCAYADSHDAFPLQRMPNISLQPGPDPAVTADDLIADVENGIYVVGHGSWSIDQQRYNFQFTGQVFHRIKNGKIDGMFRDVAYQGNSVEFWNACDGLGGELSYEVGGAFNCGKGQPQQAAPVSHGAVPALPPDQHSEHGFGIGEGRLGRHRQCRLQRRSLVMGLMTEKEARALTDRVLGMCQSDSAGVSLGNASRLNLRFAKNDVTTNGAVESVHVTVRVSFGKRSASVTVNQTDDDTLLGAVAKAEAMAKLSPENPEHMPPLGPAEFAEPKTWSDATAAAGPAEMARWVKPVVEHSRAAGVQSAGYLARSAGGSAFATSNGLFVFQRSTGCDFSVTSRTLNGGGSGWASTQATDVAGLDLEPVGQSAVAKAKQSINPVGIPPGRTTVVLEPAAVRDLIALLIWNLDRRDVDEQRSFLNALTKKKDPVGERLFGDRATLYSDPLNDAIPGATHSGGFPRTRTSWIENGVLKNLSVARFWAQKQKTDPLPGPGNVILKADGIPLEDLIKKADNGVLITRLWDIRMVQPQNLLYTGLTRDGTFRIENGAVTGPVKNFRFNESPVNLLRNLVASGIPDRVMGSESSMPMHVPALLVEDFNLSSVSDAS